VVGCSTVGLVTIQKLYVSNTPISEGFGDCMPEKNVTYFEGAVASNAPRSEHLAAAG
jgi:hypothetical protein